MNLPRILLLVALVARTTFAAASLSASPSILSKSGDDVSLKWDFGSIAFPKTGSASIGVFVPATGSDQSFLGWLPVTAVSGSMSFPVLNFREPSGVEFRLFAGDRPGKAKPIATSNLVSFANANEITGLRLAAGGDTLSYNLMFTTASACVPKVRFWTKAQAAQIVSGTSKTYTRVSLCGAPANESIVSDGQKRGQIAFRDPGQIHTVPFRLSEDDYSVRVFYQAGCDDAIDGSVYSFMSRPPPAGDTRVFAFGDLGIKSPMQTVAHEYDPAKLTVKWLTDQAIAGDAHNESWAVMHIGDISYARGSAYQWEYFHHDMEPVATRMPYMVSMGNHEFDWPSVQNSFSPWYARFGHDSGGECGVPYDARFSMPGAASKGLGNRWYSWDYGSIHFAVVNFEQDYHSGSAQYGWLEQDLAAVNRSQTPWVVLAAHRPMYTSANQKLFVVNRRETLEPLLIKYGVDLGIYGHVHQYERTCPIKDFQCQPAGTAPVQWLIGMAGNTDQGGWLLNPAPKWSEFRSEKYGYTTIFANATHLNGRYFGDEQDQLFDEFWLTTKSKKSVE